MRVLMLGWEFPPYISGGLGTACEGMTRGLDQIGVSVCFVLPMSEPVATSGHITVRGLPRPPAASENVEFRQVAAFLQPYGCITGAGGSKGAKLMSAAENQMAPPNQTTPPTGVSILGNPGRGGMYAGNLMEQVRHYSHLVTQLAGQESFDVIHAHDWMTFSAGMALAAMTGKPLAVHVHSTEFDRSGENVNQQVYDIERAGMHGANCVICVSRLTRQIVIDRYGVPPEKTEVVYNAVNPPKPSDGHADMPRHGERVVLFLGRLTMQKGPEYFLRAARQVVDRMPNVRFVMAGNGDMAWRCVELSAELGLGRNVTFTGFLRGQEVDRIFRLADVYVMPSVSEPFGITPLEAMCRDVPAIISKQSGVSEVLQHVLKVDFWDVDLLADRILAVLRHPPLQRTLRANGKAELSKLSWRDVAGNLKGIYERMMSAATGAA